MIRNSVYKSIKTVVFSNKLNLLMPFGPLAILVHKMTAHNGWVFFLSLLGITPLAERLGYATEQLAFFTGPTVGGLLNATFGNATELIISIYALQSGMIRVVQLSLLGSILSNMLLVLGCALFCGGLVYHGKEQVFSKATAVVNSGLLLMAVMGLLFPAVLHYTHTERHAGKSELALSRFSSCIMLLAYAAYLVFQLKSQKHLYVPIDEEGSQNGENSDDGDDEAPEISKWESMIWLAIMTAWISILSDYLVDTIEGASEAWDVPIAFISVILLPIIGNAAEHASAIMFAMKDKLDISLGVAIGSSTQISMFGIPFCVVIGWMMGREMDLNFQLFETATLFITVIVVAFFLQHELATLDFNGYSGFQCSSKVLNSILPVLHGVAVGAGWQAYVGLINIACYYIFGIPAGALLGFKFKFGVQGIWSGMLVGTVLQTTILLFLMLRATWQKEAVQAEERLRTWGGSTETPEASLESSAG